MSNRAVSFLIHGPSKVGKSTLATTAPYPRLYLDVEASSRFLAINAKVWDPYAEAPPIPDGTWDTAVVYVRDFDTMVKVYEWLQLGEHQFKSLIIDSISELQVRLKEKISGRGKMQIQQWDDMLRVLSGLLRDLRDLTMHPSNPFEAIVLIALTRMKDDMYRPLLQGQVADTIPYLFDVVGYLWVDQVADTNPELGTHEVRRLLTGKHDVYEAGERVSGRIPRILDNPNIEQMIDMVFPVQVAPQTTEEEA